MVKVSVTHFPATTSVTVIECNENGDGDLANCNTAGSKKATTDANKFCYLAAIAANNGQMQATNISFKEPTIRA